MKVIIKRINHIFKKLFSNAYVLYGIFFVIMFTAVYGKYLAQGHLFLLNGDSAVDLKPLVWFSRYLKEIVKNIIENHKFQIPMWEFYQYEGSDIFQGLSNAIGNPFYLLTVFVKDEYIYVFYQYYVVFMTYVSGIGFIYLCKEYEIKNNLGIISGALGYLFCTHVVFSITHHASHMIPIAYLPFIICGLEKIIKNKSPLIYIIFLFLLCTSSFYYYYMIAIALVIYALIRLFNTFKNIKIIVCYLFMIFLYSLIATLMSFVTLLPLIRIMLLDVRDELSFANYSLYPFTYYVGLIKNLFSFEFTGHNFRLGFSVIFLIAVSYLVKNIKKHLDLFSIFIILALFTTFPVFGKIMNGFSYITGRWCFFIALFACICVAYMWDEVLVFDIKKIRFSLIVSILYSVLLFYFIKIGTRPNITYQIVLLFLSIIVLLFPTTIQKKSLCFFLISLISIFITSYSYVSNHYISGDGNANKEYISKIVYQNEAMYIKDYINKTQDSDFSRYAGNYTLHRNNDYLAKVPSTQYFCSLTNPYAQKMNYNLALNRNTSHSWYIYDNSTILNALSGVKYITSANANVPLGYKKVADCIKGELVISDKINKNVDFRIYENENFTPIVYSYDNVISESLVSKIVPCDKQLVMMKSAIVNGYDGFIKNDVIFEKSKLIDYSYRVKTKDLMFEKDYIVCHKGNQEIELLFNGDVNGETYVYISNLDYMPLTNYDLYLNKDYEMNNKIYNIDPNNKYDIELLDKETTKNVKKSKLEYVGYGNGDANIEFVDNLNHKVKLKYYNNYSVNYGNYHDYNINMGYTTKSINRISIKFVNPGIYTFDSIGVYFLPLDNHVENLKSLKNIDVKDFTIGNDKVSFNMNSVSNKFLCLALSYYPGWKAYIDGVETKIYPTNYMHIGFDVPAGKHIIEFKYTNVFVIYGAIVSLIGFVLFIGAIVLYHKKHKEN